MEKLQLKGSLNQIFDQEEFLKENSKVNVIRTGCGVFIENEDIVEALGLFYFNSVSGWHHYEEEYIGYNVCTSNEYWATLSNAVERKNPASFSVKPSEISTLQHSEEGFMSVSKPKNLLIEARFILQRCLLDITGDNWKNDASTFLKKTETLIIEE